MPVLAKFRGIVIRLLIDRTFGMRLHAFYQGSELVIGLQPLRVIQGSVPLWVLDSVMDWAAQHQDELLAVWDYDKSSAMPLSRQAARQISRQPSPRTDLGLRMVGSACPPYGSSAYSAFAMRRSCSPLCQRA